MGYEVTDPEELELEEGETVICCDVLSECALNAELIDAQVEQLLNLAEKFDVDYDGGAPISKILTAKRVKKATKTITWMTTTTASVTNIARRQRQAAALKDCE